MRALYVVSGVVAILIITFTVTNIAHRTVSAYAKLRLIDDRRHQWLTEISIIDGIRQKLIAGNSSYAMALVSVLPLNNSAVATEHATNELIGTLRPLSSDARIKGGIEDAIQALKTGDANKALLDLNQARNGINQQLTNSTVVTSNSTLPRYE